MQKKPWSKARIQELLETNNEMVAKSILKLYEYQTDDEQNNGTSSKNNGYGFNKFDAEFLSSIAQWILSGKKLTQKQLETSRKRLLKYSEQLAKIANQV